MNGSTNQIDDRIARAILADSKYEQLRVRRFSYFKQPIPRKLAWQGGLFLALSLVAPIALAYPGPVAALFVDGNPLTGSPVIALVGAFAVGVELLAALGHLAVAAVLLRRKSTLSRRRARNLLAVEDVASLLGLGTGALATAVTVGYFCFGLAGLDAVQWYVAAGGRSPFAPSGTGVTIAVVALVAAVAGVALLGASRCLDRRL
ncbi:hypothetical protein DMJ13_03425 [halophilic archaeon]|nr:hypothetical protein DMJ13_03425 [halophilic archaeon]